MAIRIRVYPAGMSAGAYGVNGYGGAVSAQTYYNSKLASTKQVATLQLGYERALADERVERARLEERLKNPYLQTSALGAYGGLGTLGILAALSSMGGLNGLSGLGALGTTSAFPLLASGGGQTNITNQTSTGSGNQTVTNSNVNNVATTMQQPMYSPYATGFGGGGLISGLLGALI